jgi:cellobiose phosphorylase
MQPEFEGLLLKPCLPPSWKDCSISKKFRGCTYNIHYVQKGEGACNTIESLTVNGVAADGSKPIPPVAGEVLNIEVVLTA